RRRHRRAAPAPGVPVRAGERGRLLRSLVPQSALPVEEELGDRARARERALARRDQGGHRPRARAFRAAHDGHRSLGLHGAADRRSHRPGPGLARQGARVVSAIDLRIAWIGWVMRLFVWAIRAVLDTAFRIIILADRALSREMELQADLVSVSVSGSDSLIHALHRLGPADQAWDKAVGFAGAQAAQKKPLAD